MLVVRSVITKLKGCQRQTSSLIALNDICYEVRNTRICLALEWVLAFVSHYTCGARVERP
jgi:hypothetical protein